MVDAAMTPSTNTTCTEDVDEFLMSLQSINPMQDPVESLVAQSAYDTLVQQLPTEVRSILYVSTVFTEVNESLSTQEVNVLAYIAGYIVRQLRKKVCPPCVNKLISKLSSENPDHDLLRQKKYQDAKDGLITPSVALTDAVSTTEIQYRKVIDI